MYGVRESETEECMASGVLSGFWPGSRWEGESEISWVEGGVVFVQFDGPVKISRFVLTDCFVYVLCHRVFVHFIYKTDGLLFKIIYWVPRYFRMIMLD